MIAFAATCDAIAATPAKLVKIELLSAYFRSLDDDDLAAAARFVSGDPLGTGNTKKLAIGGRTIVAAARRLWNFTDAELSRSYRASGDLGEALGPLLREPATPPLFREPELRPATLAAILSQIATNVGRSAGKARELGCERILSACHSTREAVYAIKILTGDLRIGLREGLVIEALATAFDRPAAAVRRAAMAHGDLGDVARAAKAGTLENVEVRYFAPIGFMLASPIPFGSYGELEGGTWFVEDKFDGIRAQAHKSGDEVRLFSRTQNDVSRAFPEVVAALREQRGDFVIDGEIVARRDGRVLPFRYLQPRLQRVDPSAELIAEIPVAFVAFDLLIADGEVLVDAPLERRRESLAARVSPLPALEAAAVTSFSSSTEIEALFERSRERGNEGLLFKRAGSVYAPGRRGKAWLKLKRELSTLDCVVVAVEWGHGKRVRVLSDYTFAVRRSQGDPTLLPIGKAYTGLTDAEIAEMTEWFLAHKLGNERYGFAVEPEIVVEIAFDIIQKSGLHASGYALRFPRIVRLRTDKPASEVDTLADVERIYAAMLEREGVSR